MSDQKNIFVRAIKLGIEASQYAETVQYGLDLGLASGAVPFKYTDLSDQRIDSLLKRLNERQNAVAIGEF